MGTVIRFPQTQPIANAAGNADGRRKAAAIIILPVIRIERNADSASRLGPSRTKPTAKRRRRTSRE
jgi:hypothetical protein